VFCGPGARRAEARGTCAKGRRTAWAMSSPVESPPRGLWRTCRGLQRRQAQGTLKGLAISTPISSSHFSIDISVFNEDLPRRRVAADAPVTPAARGVGPTRPSPSPAEDHPPTMEAVRGSAIAMEPVASRGDPRRHLPPRRGSEGSVPAKIDRAHGPTPGAVTERVYSALLRFEPETLQTLPDLQVGKGTDGGQASAPWGPRSPQLSTM